MPRLPRKTILELHRAALACNLNRAAVLSGVNQALIAQLQQFPRHTEQILADLDALNELRTLVDGADPLQTWLLTARALSEPRTESRIFDHALLHLGQSTKHVSAQTSEIQRMDDFGNSLLRTRESIDACVVVGGLLISVNSQKFAGAAHRGVRIRLLFPVPQSDWLTPMVTAAGGDREEYASRITGNADRAQALGPNVNIRWYGAPTTVWFAIFDGQIAAHMAINLMSPVTPTITTDGESIRRYRRLFGSFWASASRT